MPDWLSPEWAEEVGTLFDLLPPAGDAEGSVGLAFVVAPRREVSVHWSYEGGKATSGGPGAAPEAALQLSLARADAADVLSGRVEPSVAFMRGRLKATGDGALLLAFLESTTAGEFSVWRDRVAGVAPVPL
ncbi:MAG: SCP2 sterol-binding domain-containing protein [Acidimicrobiales bacterium]|nr:SCP2 sterol-binding domain-containing protein [Acidimicrobiales bacterium]